MSEIEKLRAEYPIVYEQKVLWQHVDAARHVNNVTYVLWFEDARVLYFEQLGFSLIADAHQEPVGVVLGWQECKYVAPLFYLDTAVIGIRIIYIGRDWFTMECKMVSREQDRVVAITQGRIVGYDFSTQRKTNLPQAWITKIEALEGRSLNIV